MLKKMLISLFTIALAMPTITLADNLVSPNDINWEGTVVINTFNDQNEPLADANWQLFQGESSAGLRIKAGRGSTTFTHPSERYLYLRALSTESGDYKYYTILSENPQRLDQHGTVTFDVQYFKTKEALEAATVKPEPTETVTLFSLLDFDNNDEAVNTAVAETETKPITDPVKLELINQFEKQDQIEQAEALPTPTYIPTQVAYEPYELAATGSDSQKMLFLLSVFVTATLLNRRRCA